MDITWLGHACFRLRGRDATVVTDPFFDNAWRYPALNTTASVVTISHDHPHHAAHEAVGGAPHILRGPGEYEIGGMMVWGIQTARRNSGEGAQARNTCFVVKLDDVTICHLGDLGHSLSTEQLTHMKDSDVLLLPVGGHCTIGAAEAAEVVAQIEPRIIIPMHYGNADTEGTVELDPLERFIKEMGATEAAPQARLSVSASSLPLDPTVVLLEVRR